MSITRRLKAVEEKVLPLNVRKNIEQFCHCAIPVNTVIIPPEETHRQSEIAEQNRICHRCGKPYRQVNIITFKDHTLPEEP